MTGGGPLLLVTVGTDHHPFDRLVRWAEAWLDGHPGRLRCLMQTGTSAPPAGGAEWQAYLEYDALQEAMAALKEEDFGIPLQFQNFRD